MSEVVKLRDLEREDWSRLVWGMAIGDYDLQTLKSLSSPAQLAALTWASAVAEIQGRRPLQLVKRERQLEKEETVQEWTVVPEGEEDEPLRASCPGCQSPLGLTKDPSDCQHCGSLLEFEIGLLPANEEIANLIAALQFKHLLEITEQQQLSKSFAAIKNLERANKGRPLSEFNPFWYGIKKAEIKLKEKSQQTSKRILAILRKSEKEGRDIEVSRTACPCCGGKLANIRNCPYCQRQLALVPRENVFPSSEADRLEAEKRWKKGFGEIVGDVAYGRLTYLMHFPSIEWISSGYKGSNLALLEHNERRLKTARAVCILLEQQRKKASFNRENLLKDDQASVLVSQEDKGEKTINDFGWPVAHVGMVCSNCGGNPDSGKDFSGDWSHCSGGECRGELYSDQEFLQTLAAGQFVLELMTLVKWQSNEIFIKSEENKSYAGDLEARLLGEYQRIIPQQKVWVSQLKELLEFRGLDPREVLEQAIEEYFLFDRVLDLEFDWVKEYQELAEAEESKERARRKIIPEMAEKILSLL